MYKNIIILILSIILILTYVFNSGTNTRTNTRTVYDTLHISNYIDTTYYRDTLPSYIDTIKVIKEYYKTTLYSPKIRMSGLNVDMKFNVSENKVLDFTYKVDLYKYRHSIILNKAINNNYTSIEYSYIPKLNFKRFEYKVNVGLFRLNKNTYSMIGVGFNF